MYQGESMHIEDPSMTKSAKRRQRERRNREEERRWAELAGPVTVSYRVRKADQDG